MGPPRCHGRKPLRFPASPECHIPSYEGTNSPLNAPCSYLITGLSTFPYLLQTLQKYTREYLFEKFRAEVQLQASSSHTMPVRASQSTSMSRLPPISHGQRPVLAIDTAPSHTSSNRHPSLSISRSGISHNGEIGSSTVTTQSSSTVPDLSPKTASSSRQSFYSARARFYVIALVVSVFAVVVSLLPLLTSPVLTYSLLQGLSDSEQRRSQLRATSAAVGLIAFSATSQCTHGPDLLARKLKCDGGRPACSQCYKRSNPCDYMTNHKRRGAANGRQRKQNAGSDSDCESGDEPSGDAEDPSQSPEVVSQPPSRRNSNVSMLLTDTLPPLTNAVERREDASTKLPSIQQATSGLLGPPPSESHTYSGGHELPPIATLSAASASAHDEGNQSLPSIRSVDTQPQRRRTSSSTTSGRGPRQSSGNGSKIVACNYCRGALSFLYILAQQI